MTLFQMFFTFSTLSISWASGSHTEIGEHALTLLKNDSRPAYNFYVNENSKYLNVLKRGWWDPDIVEFSSGTHYYIWPGEGTVNTGQYYPMAPKHKKNESARTRLEEHYSNALKYYKDGDMKKAMQQIGRACHFIGDIGCPPHSSGIQYPTNPLETNYHHLFESYASKVMKDSSKTYPHATTAKDAYGKLKSPWGVEINNVCETSARQHDNIITKDEKVWDKAITVAGPLSERYVAALLDQFYQDTH